MVVSYFPGCTLKNKALDLDLYARKSAEALGVVLEEIDNWQCCGGVFTTSQDEIATKLSSVRALKFAADRDQPLVTVCSACHNVIKQTDYAMKNNVEFASKANRYLGKTDAYTGNATVYHYLELLRDVITFDKVKEKTVYPLKGKKIAPYYGCLLLRPSKVMKTDDSENPTLFEDFIRAIGGKAVVYAKRNECCGGYISLESPETAKKNSKSVINNAKAAGAEIIVTACPLCKYNLEKSNPGLPVVYFTELLAEALGVKEADGE